MDITATLAADLDPAALLEVVADLSTYPRWLDIVGDVVSDADGGVQPAWVVELRAQLGPIRRSKRLRMVRADLTARTVRFERAELDGREHSAWVLDAVVRPTRPSGAAVNPSTELEMRLHYGGSLWGPLLDRIVRDEIRRSRPRLVASVAARHGGPSPR